MKLHQVIDTINERLEAHVISDYVIVGFGKPGVGMNGPGALRSHQGQCFVRSATCRLNPDVVDLEGVPQLVVDMVVDLHAYIEAPSHERIALYRDTLPFVVEEELARAGVDAGDDRAFFECLLAGANRAVAKIPPEAGALTWDPRGLWVLNNIITIPCHVSQPLLLAFGSTLVPEHIQILAIDVGRALVEALHGVNEDGTPTHHDIARFGQAVGQTHEEISRLLWAGPTPPRFVVAHTIQDEAGNPLSLHIFGPYPTRSATEETVARLADHPAPSLIRMFDLLPPPPQPQTQE